MKKFILALGLLATISVGAADWSLFSTKAKAAVIAQPVRARIAVVNFTEDTDLKKMTMQLRDLARDPKVHGVLLMIDNRGGYFSQFSPVYDMVKKLSTIKPVVGFVNGYAQSCGYWVASAVNYLVAPSIVEIGAIGVILTIDRYDDPKLIGEVKSALDVELFKAGKYKAVVHPYADKLSEEEKRYVQEGVEKLYLVCVKQIAANRNLDPENSQDWADGKVFLSDEALELGLIDEIGTMFEAENKLIALIHEQQPTVPFEDTVELVFSGNPVASEKPTA